MMMASKSYERHPAHKALYDALPESIYVDKNEIDRLAVDPASRREDKGKNFESSKKTSTSKESLKGKTLPKSSKTRKSVHAEETVEEDNEETVEEDLMKWQCDCRRKPTSKNGIYNAEIFHIWKAFGRLTRDLGSFREETDKTTDLHQHLSRISPQRMETASQIQRDVVTMKTKTASQDLMTASKNMTQPII
ncbi:hypothetical protein Tco_1180213 [Tanacetum coccineum]